jgi:Na+-transporting methylmalonyl-CoA/oxaloacetate decarboxylase gamma subunit
MGNVLIGLKLMGFGLAGVFTVLILFYFMIKILMRVFNENEEKTEN